MYSAIYRSVKSLMPEEREKLRILTDMKDIQWLSKPELESIQLAKIQNLIKYAYEHVPYYRERYQREDIHPQDVKSWEDFRRLPYLTREDVNNHLDDLVSPEFRGRLWQSRTGGSTGEPMRFYVDSSFHTWNGARVRLTRGWYGVRDGDKIAWVWGAERDMPGWSRKERLMAQIRRHRYLNAFHMTEDTMQAFAELLLHWQPDMIRAYPSVLSLFTQFLVKKGVTGIHPRLVVCTAEMLTESQRQLFEEVFECRVANCYSSREFSHIAYECEKGGLHVCYSRYMELVEDGKTVEPGQMGEIVITSLHQYAMPFIRYKNGDMGVYEPGGCVCGRGLPVLKEIVGRVNDIMVTTQGDAVHGFFFNRVLRARPNIVRYQVYQPDRQHLEIRLVCKEDAGSEWFEDIRNDIRARFGASMQISFQMVDDFEMSPAGKHRYIVSDVQP
jgi:phenylacetate-CoA ligase